MTQPRAYSYIRFSTSAQAQGDSLRRQLEASQKYAVSKGLVLDETLTLKDLGISAFKGANKTKGALSGFLKAVEAGTIPAGSILIVESIDRLSREQISDALPLFMSIINGGVTIATMMDNREYSRETINANVGELVMSLMIMSRAHEESIAKSKRIGKAWANKRKQAVASGHKITKNCPPWLRLNAKAQVFEIIPERAEVVKLMFQLYAEGNGGRKITKKLNEMGIKPFNGKVWLKDAPVLILHNKATIGHFQPHRTVMEDGKRRNIPDGEPIKDYFPAIIDEKTFYATQERLSSRKRKGGRTGLVRCLFTHLAKCGSCGASMHYHRLNAKYSYLQCQNHNPDNGCPSRMFPYPVIEEVFLTQCAELDVSMILPKKNGRAAKIIAAQEEVDAIRGRQAENAKAISNAEKILDTTDSDAVLQHYTKKLGDALIEKEDLVKRLSDAQIALTVAESETVDSERQLQNLKALNDKLDAAEGDEKIQLRGKLRNTIAALVERIRVFPDGAAVVGDNGETVGDVIAHYENVGFDTDIFKSKAEYDKLMMELRKVDLQNSGKEKMAFLVHFRAGGWRFIQRDGKGWENTVNTPEGFMKYIGNMGVK